VIDPPETPRLRAERLVPDHHDALCTLLGDPRVGATLGGAMSREQVETALAAKLEHWDRNGFGYWLWRERATGDAVARGGLHRVHVGGRDEVEVGWAVMPERWGEGFATELGAASLGVAFDVLELPDVVAYTLPDNRASRRVMEKLGMRFERDIVHAGLPHVLYRRAAAV
jgi:RimJ/RimL family protein N-acetyltransferase